ncbi:hypothetical protein LUZ60_012894 [Juncus effusus]|nr:hypothetical protein LUZ60_012894 [Juncus effusus]
MEMEMPALEELEWLESNSLLPEEPLDDEYFFDGEDLHADPSRPSHISPTSTSRDTAPSVVATDSQNSKKRPRQDEIDSSSLRPPASHVEEISSDAKEKDSDEDWLHYSPKKGKSCSAEIEVDVQMPDVAEKIISRFASEIDGDCMAITGPDGQRVYAKLRSMDALHHKLLLKGNNTSTGLLSEPISILNELVEQESLAKALQESFESQAEQTCGDGPVSHERLWVEKYAPNSFTELLSDEHTNREVLLWLKQWDPIVFGSNVRSTSDDVLSALRIHSSITQTARFPKNQNKFSMNKGGNFMNQNRSSWGDGTDRENSNLNGSHSSWNKKTSFVNKQPEQKVLLLCGPPGLGKTTLAHVAAKHCGYRVVEINASDDRSAASIESKILDVLQMNSVMPDAKPKCLVIDEIDGALGDGKGAVDVILKMLAAEKKNLSEKGDDAELDSQQKKASSKKGHKPPKLSRPVICICNDLYAPALRQLRQVAKVHTFVQPTTTRVVNRLKYICMKEGFKTNSIALSALAECTECDIRSCLNTLQFLNKKKQALGIVDVDTQVIGRKDMSRSAFDVWKAIFHKQKPKRRGKSVNSEGDTDHLYSLISGRGEYELTMDGIHENFLKLSYHDPMMQKTVKCMDVLGTSDSLINYVYRTQHMQITAYQPSMAVSLSRLIAQVDKPNIEWPKSFHRCRAMHIERKDMLKTWEKGIRPSISRHISVDSFVQDIASPFLHIISPPNLRPVALHLLSEREKDELVELTDTMVSYSITYKYSKHAPQEKMYNNNIFGEPSDESLLSLDPPIPDFVNFKGYQSEFFGLSLAMKHILVHEIEKQRMLQESIGKSMNRTDTSANQKSTNHNTATLAKTNPPASSVEKISNRQKPAETNAENLPAPKKTFHQTSNFFDRFKKESNTDAKTEKVGGEKAGTIQRDSRPLLFKYNEVCCLSICFLFFFTSPTTLLVLFCDISYFGVCRVSPMLLKDRLKFVIFCFSHCLMLLLWRISFCSYC